MLTWKNYEYLTGLNKKYILYRYLYHSGAINKVAGSAILLLSDELQFNPAINTQH